MKLLFRAGQTFFIYKIQLLSESGNFCSSKWHIWIKQVLFVNVRERGLKQTSVLVLLLKAFDHYRFKMSAFALSKLELQAPTARNSIIGIVYVT